MNFTDIFIKRPVLAMVVSLLIVVLGLRSLASLPVNQYPKTQNAVVTISTTYYGADAQTVAGFITQPLEGAIAQAQGIDYLSSSSSSGVSTITATLRLNYDANRALTEINTQVNSVKNQLPAQAQAPVLTVATGSTIDAMYLGFYSDTLPTKACRRPSCSVRACSPCVPGSTATRWPRTASPPPTSAPPLPATITWLPSVPRRGRW